MTTPTITLWGRRSGFHARKVIWALEELALPYALIDAGYGVEPTAALRARNPNLLAPVIDIDGVVVRESNVIVRYLCAAFGDGVLARNHTLLARIEAEQWMDWTVTTLWPVLRPLHHARIRGHALDDDAHAKLGGELGRWLDVLEQQLSTEPYLAGNAFSMADIPAGLSVDRAAKLDLIGERPNLRRWWTSLTARPAFPVE